MNRRFISVLSAMALAGAIPAMVGQSPANAVDSSHGDTNAAHTTPAKQDDKPDALNSKRRALKQRAASMVATGEATAVRKHGSKVVNLGTATKANWVEYEPTETAQLLTFLVDFGDGEGNSAYPENTAGPVHDEIPEPGEDDNSTYWESDFSAEHYQEMFFDGLADQDGESFHQVYQEMSSGRFDLQGDVSDWVSVDHPESYYQSATGDETATAMKNYIQDTANAWYDDQVADGRSKAEIKRYLESFDVWDRYDYDGDGNYNEPDGYIDHFQAIHAGEGEEAGADPWTIWSHRWAANASGTDGPEDFPASDHVGGVQIGDTGLWIRDYTTEPENGGLGVFAHEFGHDLGLPDYYDTAGGDNSTGYWTLMSSGSWLGHGGDAIGTTPNQMGPTEKLFLGWLDYASVEAGESAKVTLGPSYHDTGTDTPQALVVNLPDGSTTYDVGSGSSGTTFLYSGSGDDRTATAVSPDIVVPDAGELTAKVNYDLEAEYDFTYVEASTDGGSTWTILPTNLSDPDFNNGIDGTSDSSCDTNCADTDPAEWVDLTADLSDYAGQTVKLRFRTANDGGVHYYGFAVDDLAVGSAYSTDFDTFDDWTVKDYYEISDGTYSVTYQRYYVAENRQFLGYDTTLGQGPYNFGWPYSAPNKVEHYSYEPGLLVWYANGLYDDNNTSTHPGGGQALPVDAHPRSYAFSNGDYANARLQASDATFGLTPTEAVTLHRETDEHGTMALLKRPSLPAVSEFDDADSYAYYDAATPEKSTLVAGTGTVIRVLGQDSEANTMTVQVGREAPMNEKAPTITGTPMVGKTLTAHAGSWSQEVTSTFTWYAGSSRVGSGATLKLTPATAGTMITVVETATGDGTVDGTATSAATEAVASAPTRTAVRAGAAKAGARSTATVTVTASGLVPTGSVKVTYAGTVVAAKAALRSGRVTVTLPAKKAGSYRLVARYVPAKGFAASSGTVKVTVRR
ncbi:MAG: immune inhibitor A [Nocardioides sp.]|uniref:immune inhibitor A domain-containing protein n=1 Tax=Nocardioides sp. TaxID=35761 RepID=UPI0039E543A4